VTEVKKVGMAPRVLRREERIGAVRSGAGSLISTGRRMQTTEGNEENEGTRTKVKKAKESRLPTGIPTSALRRRLRSCVRRERGVRVAGRRSRSVRSVVAGRRSRSVRAGFFTTEYTEHTASGKVPGLVHRMERRVRKGMDAASRSSWRRTHWPASAPDFEPFCRMAEHTDGH